MPRFSSFKIVFFLGSVWSAIFMNAETFDNTARQILNGSSTYEIENYSISSVEKSFKTESNLPDPQIAGEYLVAPADESNRWSAELSWELEWPGVYSARAKQAQKRIEAARLNVIADRLDRLAEIKIKLLDYILISKKLDILEQLALNNDTIYHLSEKATKGGDITVLDLNKVRLEYANIRAAQAALMSEKESVIASLSEEYGHDCSDLLKKLPISFPEIVLPTEVQVLAIKENTYRKDALVAEADAVKQQKKVVSMESLPSLSVGYKHNYEDGIHFNGALLGISIPLFSSRGKQKAVEAAIAESDFKAEALTSSINALIDQQIKKLSMLKTQLDDIAPLMENADHNTLLLRAYRSNLITMIDYLAERNYFTNAAMELLSLRHEAAVTQVQLMKYSESLSF